jgi:hypothetical protein
MVIDMNQNYLVIQNGIVTNTCVWDGNTETWVPPSNSLLLVQATTPSKVWAWAESKNDFELSERLGGGAPGFIWDGTFCVTPHPKPTL